MIITHIIIQRNGKLNLGHGVYWVQLMHILIKTAAFRVYSMMELRALKDIHVS